MSCVRHMEQFYFLFLQSWELVFPNHVPPGDLRPAAWQWWIASVCGIPVFAFQVIAFGWRHHLCCKTKKRGKRKKRIRAVNKGGQGGAKLFYFWQLASELQSSHDAETIWYVWRPQSAGMWPQTKEPETQSERQTISQTHLAGLIESKLVLRNQESPAQISGSVFCSFWPARCHLDPGHGIKNWIWNSRVSVPLLLCFVFYGTVEFGGQSSLCGDVERCCKMTVSGSFYICYVK